jgi:hypothetical protein
MKHILNNLTEEEKNAIREQHTGGIKIVNENFSKLVNTKLGDVKPMVNEQDGENLSQTQKTILRLIKRGKIIQAIRMFGGKGFSSSRDKDLFRGLRTLLKVMSNIDWNTDENRIINISNIIKHNLDGEINVDDLFYARFSRHRVPKLIINDGNGGVSKIVVLFTEGVVVEVYPEDFDKDTDDYSLVTSYELPWEEVPSNMLSDIFDALIDFVVRKDLS